MKASVRVLTKERAHEERLRKSAKRIGMTSGWL